MRGAIVGRLGGCLLLTLAGCATGDESTTEMGPLTLGGEGPGEGSDTDDGQTSTDTATTNSGSATSSSSGSGGDNGDSTTAADTTGGGPPSAIIDCDDAWDLDPDLPVAGQELWAGFTAADPHVEIGIIINGDSDSPLIIEGDFYDTNGGSPWTWWWTIGGIEPGAWTLEFVRDQNQPGGPIVEGTCVFEVF